jgi:hypothetical protein
MNGGGISSTNSDNEQEAEQTGIRCSFVQQTAGTPGFLRAKDVPRCKSPAETAKTAKNSTGAGAVSTIYSLIDGVDFPGIPGERGS